VHETLADDDRPGPGPLLAHAATFSVWLTAALAVAGYASGDRYPGYLLFWAGLLSAAGFLVPLGLLGAVGRRVPRLARSGPLAAAFCILFTAALSLDVGPEPRVSTRLGAARLLCLGVSLALAAWSLSRGRASRLGLGAAMALLCSSWMLCGVLRGAGAPQALGRPSILLPLVAAVVLLLPGLPRLDPPRSRLRWATTLAAAAALVVLPLSPRVLRAVPLAAPSAAPPAGGRSAVLIVLDTLRRDHLSLYGYTRKTTPALDERAARGLVFDDATAVAPWTLPSHASMFTGLWPRTHGAHAFRPVADQSGNIYPLSPERVTLAEIAREHGYRTAGFSSNNAYMSSRWGIDQGFGEYVCRKPRLAGVRLGAARELAWRWDQRRALYEEMPYFTAPEMTRAAITWLGRHGDQPFFLFLNYMDVHFPNAAPGTQGLAFEDEASVLGEKKHEGFARYFLGGALTPAERRAFVNEYDRELIHLDHWVGVLLRYLEESDLDDTTLVVLTADHGEFLGEHELIAHMKDLYNEVVDVPLVVWEPGATPGRSARPVQGLDLFPTILGYLGLPVPEGTQGQSLLDVDHATVSELYYALQPMMQGAGGSRYDRVLRTIREDGYRYFHSSNGEERLFRLGADPREERNLIAERPDVAAAARARLEEWLRTTPEAAPAATPQGVDPETLENLRALGYVR
jgi:arylsulfatase A-like enzyme